MSFVSQKIIYSVIIPHKNIPVLLQRCLDSIPRREDIQIIVVDDNSDENKVNFNKFPGLNDDCVEIYFTKESKGAGYARNIGLRHAKGKWILFADADDYFTPSFIQSVDKYMNSPYDLIYFGVNGIDARTQQTNSRGRKYNNLMERAILHNDTDLYKYKAYVPWGKMINSSLIGENNIVFDETFVANDMMFSIKTAYFSKNTFFDRVKIYTLESRNVSLMSIKSPKAELDRLKVYIALNDFSGSVLKKKYEVPLIGRLYKLLISSIITGNIAAFFHGINLMKKNKISLTKEIFRFITALPKWFLMRIKRIIDPI
jgi:glycosyltransferase involved in cell wall biosynthesis